MLYFSSMILDSLVNLLIKWHANSNTLSLTLPLWLWWRIFNVRCWNHLWELRLLSMGRCICQGARELWILIVDKNISACRTSWRSSLPVKFWSRKIHRWENSKHLFESPRSVRLLWNLESDLSSWLACPKERPPALQISSRCRTLSKNQIHEGHASMRSFTFFSPASWTKILFE